VTAIGFGGGESESGLEGSRVGRDGTRCRGSHGPLRGPRQFPSFQLPSSTTLLAFNVQSASDRMKPSTMLFV
jgi:hypothetical protein